MTCMNCRSQFTKVQIETLLGKRFVKEVIIAGEIADLVETEKALIPATHILVKYMRDRTQHKQMLIGKGQLELGDTADAAIWNQKRPLIRGTHWTNIQCSEPECKGMLHNKSGDHYLCNLCATTFCVHCVDKCTLANLAGHACNPDLVQTIDAIRNTTRPCPRCKVRITKTMGCNDMHCTHCNVKFSWNTMKILKHSTNHHYQAFNNNHHDLEDTDLEVEQPDDHLMSPQIPEDVMTPLIPEHFPEHLNRALYEQSANIRAYYFAKCVESKIISEYNLKCDNLRLLFMDNTLNETAWGRALYQCHKIMRMKLMHHEIIKRYLTEIGKFQSETYNALTATTATTTTTTATTATTTTTTTTTTTATTATTTTTATYDLLLDIYNRVLAMIHKCNTCFESVNLEFYCCKSETRYRFSLPSEIGTVVLTKNTTTETETHAVETNTTDTNTTDINTAETDAVEKETAEKETAEKETAEKVILKDIHILEHQVEHYLSTCHILKHNPYFLDLSRPGGGKTYNALKYIQTHKFDHVYVVCPAIVRNNKWIPTIKEYGPTNVQVMSFQELCSTTMNQPKHGLLQRDDFTELRDQGRQEVKMVMFEITEKFRNMLNSPNGVLFIFDEIQYIKQEHNATTKASRAIMTAIMSSFNNTTKTKNRLICMSGTPMDEATQFTTFFRNIGVQRTNLLFVRNPYTGEVTRTGYADIINYCIDITNQARHHLTKEYSSKIKDLTQTISNARTQMVWAKCFLATIQDAAALTSGCGRAQLAEKFADAKANIQAARQVREDAKDERNYLAEKFREMEQRCVKSEETIAAACVKNIETVVVARVHIVNLFTYSFKPFMSSRMQIPDTPFRVINVNTFYRLDSRSTELCDRAIANMVQIVNSSDGSIHGVSRINMFAAMQMLDISHINVLIGEARQTLQDPNASYKVVIVVNYTECITRAAQALAEFSPLILSGETTANERNRRVGLFQAPTAECRLLICNIGTMCCGIDLDDKDGRFPRRVFVCPTYKTISMYQMSLRFLRSVDTKSNTIIRYIYSIKSVVSNIDIIPVQNKIKDLVGNDAIIGNDIVGNRTNNRTTVKVSTLQAIPLDPVHFHPNMYVDIEKQVGMKKPSFTDEMKINQEMRVIEILNKKSNILQSISDESADAYPGGFYCQITAY